MAEDQRRSSTGSRKFPTLILPDGNGTGPVTNKYAAVEPMDLVQVEEELMDMMLLPEDFLTEDEEEVLEEFCGDIARIRRLNDRDATREYAVKFLMARKFNPSRAFSLYQRYKMVRHKYDMDKLQPTVDPLYSELATGKFTFMEQTEGSGGEAIGIFTGALHNPNVDMNLLMQGLLFNIDEALRSFSTVACGITILINLKGMKPSKDDRVMAETILGLLQDRYPARIKRIFIIDAPWYMRRLFQVLSPFLKTKMRERVFMVKSAQLLNFFPPTALPVALGGMRLPHHAIWLTRAINHYLYIKGSRPYAGNATAFQRKLLPDAKASLGSMARKSLAPTAAGSQTRIRSPSLPAVDVIIAAEQHPVGMTASDAEKDPVGYLRALHLMNGLTLAGITDFLNPHERKDLFEEFHEIQAAPQHGVFLTTRLPCNSTKNRYADIFCMESTRVKLNPVYLPNGDFAHGSDYIHANFVGGLHQARSYILCQGPMESTVGDFWRMVWEQRVRVVVMTANLVENAVTKCFQYWPKADSVVRIADFSLRVTDTHTTLDWTRRSISIRKASAPQSRQITHYQFTTWSDKGPVKNSIPMIQVFLDMHRRNDFQDMPKSAKGPNLMSVPASRVASKSLPDASELDKPLSLEESSPRTQYPPILVHCSSGVGRSAAFVAADICCIAVMQGTVDVAGTVCYLRTQRAQSVQTLAQYKFIYQAVVEYGRLLQAAEGEDELWETLLQDMPTSHSQIWVDNGKSSSTPTSGSGTPASAGAGSLNQATASNTSIAGSATCSVVASIADRD